MTPLMGILYRMFHLKILFLVMIAIFELGSLVAATAQSSAILIVGRAISGVGSSGIITGATTMTAATVPLSKRTFIIGISMGCLAVGQTLGPLIGGLLTTYVSWRWCFYMYVPSTHAPPFVLVSKVCKSASASHQHGLTFFPFQATFPLVAPSYSSLAS